MKNLFILFLFGLLLSCSSDDSSDENVTVKNYFPIHNANSWHYGRTGGTSMTSHIDGTSTIEGHSFHNLLNQDPIFGVEGNGNVRKDGVNYYYSGVIQLAGLPPIPVTNQLFLKDNSTNGSLINSIDLVTTLDEMHFTQTGFSATVTPTVYINLKIKQTNHYDSIELNGSTMYNDVLEIDGEYTVSCDLVFSNTGIFNVADHELISETPAASLKQFFANDIGVVRSIFDVDFSTFNYNTNLNTPIGPIDITPFLQNVIDYFNTYDFTVVSELSSYNVN